MFVDVCLWMCVRAYLYNLFFVCFFMMVEECVDLLDVNIYLRTHDIFHVMFDVALL